MKKLMIAAAIVCAAAMAQAYSVTWGMGVVNAADGSAATKSNISVLLVNITEATYGSLVEKYSTYTDGNAISADLYKTYKDSTGVAGTQSVSKGATNFKEAQSYNAGESSYKVIIYTSTDANGDLNYIANMGVVAIDAASPKDNSANSLGSKYFADTTKTVSWQTVPEPTSGLLLLLGVAGLALRRRA